MQYDKLYKGVTQYKAITINEADEIAIEEISEVLRDENSPYRGEVLLVTPTSLKNGREGMIVGRTTIKDIKAENGRFLWIFENSRRMIEFPCQQVGNNDVVWDCFYTSDTLMDYPKINLRNILNL